MDFETRPFGPPSLGISLAPLGVGVWPWGSRWYWGYGRTYGEDDVRGAFRASLAAGVTLFDTAELYGRGESERVLGRLAGELADPSRLGRGMDSRFRGNEGNTAGSDGGANNAANDGSNTGTNGGSNGGANDGTNTGTDGEANGGPEIPPPFIATKYLPVPWRWRTHDVARALRASLRRLGVERVDLYQIHWPIVPARPRLRQWMDGLIRAHGDGLVTAVGVSNFDADLTRRAHDILSRAGIPLASNQLPYSLLDRHIEHEGLLDVCAELGVSVIAYSPIAEGLLTGKYTPDARPAGYRGWRLRKKVVQAQPIVAALRSVAERYEGTTPTQIALRWLIQKGAMPIPGAKNAQQATDNAGALGWTLSDGDMAELDEVSAGF